MSRMRMRDDLLERIKERHDQWFEDAMELYQMGRLRPGECANDAVTVMTYTIVSLLDFYGVGLDQFEKGMRQTMKSYREAKQ